MTPLPLPRSASGGPIDRERLIEEFAEWLAEHEWAHWLTLTSSSGFNPCVLKRLFTNQFLRKLARIAQQRVGFFLVIEGGALGDNPHLHVLLRGTEGIGLERLMKLWRWGRAEVAVFDPSRGAVRYLLKDIDHRVLDWDFGPRVRPHR